jgi:hypothetical protein
MTSRPVRYSALVGLLLGAVLTVMIVVSRGCRQLQAADETCAHRELGIFLIGLPLMVTAGWVALGLVLGLGRGLVIQVLGSSAALAALFLATAYVSNDYAYWATPLIGAASFAGAAVTLRPAAPRVVRLAAAGALCAPLIGFGVMVA